MSSSKANSLKWAIEELSKQRGDMENKLKVAQKRDETNSLIEEVFAQKNALEQRISALEDGLQSTSDLVSIPCSEIEAEMLKIDEKLDIARERLHSIEQEEYLEELGNKLNRKSNSIETVSHTDDPAGFADEFIDTLEVENQSPLPPDHLSKSLDSSNAFSVPTLPSTESSSTATTSSQIMKATTNRIQKQDIEENVSEVDSSVKMSDLAKTDLSLEETALQLGVEPSFLAEKGLNAILRMISRNGGKLSFPLEVEQID